MLPLRLAREVIAFSETTAHRFWMPAAATIAAALTAFVACGDGDSLSDADGAVAGGVVRSMQIISETDGWVLTDERLLLSVDGGQNWNDVTPPGISPADIRGATFIDATNGWVAASGAGDDSGATQLVSGHTEDGGNTWAIAHIGSPDIAYTTSQAGSAYFSFADAKHGWLIVQLQSGAQFSVGELFRTEDGGATWEQLPDPPIAGQIAFADENTGVATGGAAGDQVHLTHDGGVTWQRAQLPLSGEVTSAYPVFGSPVASPQGILLPVSFVGSAAGPSYVGFYSSADGGRAWELNKLFPWPDTLEIGVGAPSDADEEGLVAVEADGGKVVAAANRAAEWSVVSPNGLPATVVDVDFASGRVGWALVVTNACLSEKTNCIQSQGVFATTDSAQTWASLQLP